MGTWVYFFAKFTPEALLFEVGAMSVLCAAYAMFWVLRKRRLGSASRAVPADVVKLYLNEIITDAEQMRSRLFGLLGSAGSPIPVSMPSPVEPSFDDASAQFSAQPSVSAVAGDPQAAQKFAALEAKLAEKEKTLQSLLSDKTKMEKDLAALKAAPAASGGDNKAVAELQEKMRGLEEKLAEYSVIEDDLANLKRLQQENVQLRQMLKEKGVSVPDSDGSSAAAAAAAPATPTAEAIIAAATAEIPAAAELAAGAGVSPLDALAAADSAATQAPGSEFEGLVDQVEQSLGPAGGIPAAAASPPPAGATAGAGDAAATPPSTDAPPAASLDKSDADLVAEFEKMLNS